MYKSVDFVIPCYNEESIIETTYERIRTVAKSLGLETKFIFIDDGSKDETWGKIKQISETDSRVCGIRFSRNFGHQRAVLAGLDYSKGDLSLILDADLQDPPELAKEMIKLAEQGYNVIYGIRRKREGESFLKKFTAKAFYFLINLLSPHKIPVEVGDFRLVDRRTRENFCKIRENFRLNREIWCRIRSKQTGLTFIREPRVSGKTKYNYRRMFGLAIDGIVATGTNPIKYLLGGSIGIIVGSFIICFIRPDIGIMGLLFGGGLLAVSLLGWEVAKAYQHIKEK